uniref:UDP-N-acetylglucosamine--dolichyl-phosphate N-acetylglucosaminephosphotransferase n=1 Tax=Lygus hesperus TaxID=30085 RepID=A0A146KPP5_LYGHE
MYTGGTYVKSPSFLEFIFWDSSANVPTWISKSVSYIHIYTVENHQGVLLNLSYYYYIYMCMLTIFCTNSINIYAGINGLEVGQSLIIAITILCINVYELLISNAQSSLHLLS